MLEGTLVHPHSQMTARKELGLWLIVNAEGMEYTQENGVKLADLFPGFVDVSFLMNVWKELTDDE